MENEWARSVLDVPHRFVASGIWESAVAARSGRVPAGVLGGWTVSAAYVRQSGQPWTPLSQANSVGNGDVQVQRAIVNTERRPADTGTRSSPVRNSAGAIVGYLANDPNARFVQAGVGSMPTAERNSLRAPGINNIDLMVSKILRDRRTRVSSSSRCTSSTCSTTRSSPRRICSPSIPGWG